MDKERMFIRGEMKQKKSMENMRWGGYLFIADFTPPEGDEQMGAEEAEVLFGALQMAARYQMLTKKEVESIATICTDAAVRCGYLKEVTEEMS